MNHDELCKKLDKEIDERIETRRALVLLERCWRVIGPYYGDERRPEQEDELASVRNALRDHFEFDDSE